MNAAGALAPGPVQPWIPDALESTGNGHNGPLQLHRDDNSTDSNSLSLESFGKKEHLQAKIKA